MSKIMLKLLVMFITGNATYLAFYLSPISTFWRIYKFKSTKECSGLPYVFTLFNCYVGLLYGSPFVKPRSTMILTINNAGFVLETFYLTSFLTFALPKRKRCDGSVLLDDTATFEGEKTTGLNLNSSSGFEVIDYIKEELESACPAQVSCADILAMAARDSVVLTRGPYWEVSLGRRDSLTASKAAVAKSLPAPTSNISTLICFILVVQISSMGVYLFRDLSRL